MTQEYESKVNKNLKIAIAALIGTNLLTIIIKLDGLQGFQAIASIGMLIWTFTYIFKDKSNDSVAILKHIVNKWKKETDKLINTKGWTSGEMPGFLYFYFPEEGFGLEYDLINNRIGAKQLRTVVMWEHTKMNNKIMSEIIGEKMKDERKDQFMESQGFTKKD